MKHPGLNPQDPLGEPDVLNDPLVRTLSQQVIERYGAGREKLPEHQNDIAVERVPFPPGSGVGKSVDQSWLVHDLGTITASRRPSSDALPNLSSPGCDGWPITRAFAGNHARSRPAPEFPG